MEYLSRTALLRRDGWTNAQINKYLGKADDHRRINGRLHSLFLMNRIEKMEQSADFVSTQDMLAKRREAGYKAVETRIASMREEIESSTVNVKQFSLESVRLSAIQAYEQYNLVVITNDADQSFIDRITVNFIRLNLTEFDQALFRKVTLTSNASLCKYFRKRLLSQIATVYPDLKEECEHQVEARSSLGLMS